MNSDTPEPRSLHEIEIEGLAEGREWTQLSADYHSL